jgi:hypothetical protein
MDYFTRLAQQALDVASEGVVQPRLLSRFEPVGMAAGLAFVAEQRIEIEREAPPLSAQRSAPPPLAAARPAPMALRPGVEAQSPAYVMPPSLPLPGRQVAGQVASVERRPATAALATPSSAEPNSATARVVHVLAGSGEPVRAATTARSAGSMAIAPAPQPPCAAAPRAAADQRPAAPVIRVSIGRVDVRAVTRAAPPPTRTAPTPQPAAPLEAYLRADKGGRSR